MRFTFATCPFYLFMILANMYAQHANFSIKQVTQINATSLNPPPECSSESTMAFFRHKFQITQAIIILLEITMVHLMCMRYFASQHNILV